MAWAEYIESAAQLRKFEFLDDDEYFCHIPERRGVWATGLTVDACILELREVLVDWIQIGIEMGYTIPNLPSSDGATPDSHPDEGRISCYTTSQLDQRSFLYQDDYENITSSSPRRPASASPMNPRTS
ncbi:hypothetical protein BH23CHL1_BH23CHL1_09890 [soil metagenome]